MKISNDELLTIKEALNWSIANSTDEIHDTKSSLLLMKVEKEIIKRDFLPVVRVFRFDCGKLCYAYSAKSEEEARQALFDESGAMVISNVVEIPKSKWNDKIISMREDNDPDNEEYKVSINEIMLEGFEPQLLFTNDIGML